MFRNDRPFHGWLQRDPEAQRGAAAIGRALRDARLRERVSQRRLEEATGVDQTTISRLERGMAPGLRLERLGRIVDALGGDLALCPHLEPSESGPVPPDLDAW
jgi:transcriptional regulator with XRE-family HTH domain